MGKYIGYVILIIVVIFLLEWFQIVDVPFLEIPDSISRKKEMVDSSKDVLEQMDWSVAQWRDGLTLKDLTYADKSWAIGRFLWIAAI